jgi:outer membrane lipoprotein-sorting protein
MRSVLVLIGLACHPFAWCQGSKEAEDLVRKMEDKLLKAKTIALKVKVKMEGEVKSEMKGELLIELAAHKLRYEVEGQAGGSPAQREVLSNGVKMKSYGFDGAYWVEDLNASLSGTNFVAAFTRLGLHRGIELGGSIRGGFDVQKQTTTSGVKAVRREKVGGKDTLVTEVTVRLVTSGGTSDQKVTLWIDEKTWLPVKSFRDMSGELQWTLTEEFTEFHLDESIEPGKFQFPN